MPRIASLPVAVVLILCCCTRNEKPVEQPVVQPVAAAATSSVASAPAATEVKDPSLVCMVTDRFMGVPQLPVKVAEKTYYGCCEMCVAKLQNQAQFRLARDPVSGREVDKVGAVVGRLADGRVLYFESAQTLARYTN